MAKDHPSPNRREFLGAAGALLAFAGLNPAEASESVASLKKVGPVGVQLYSVRDAMKADFAGTLAHVARIGYKEVEFAGYFDKSPREIRALLKKNGLTAPSAHIGFPVLGASWDKIIADAEVVGHRYLICPWIDEKLRTIDGYKQVADLFNHAGERARKAGMQFGFHNHDYEFPPIDGQVPLDLLMTQTDPKLVAFEMDVFWITNAGKDPLAYFKRFPGRFPLLHIKDRDASGKMVSVGKGAIDWKAVLRHRTQAGTKHIFVEHDNPADPFASIADSYAYLRKLNV